MKPLDLSVRELGITRLLASLEPIHPLESGLGYLVRMLRLNGYEQLSEAEDIPTFGLRRRADLISHFTGLGADAMRWRSIVTNETEEVRDLPFRDLSVRKSQYRGGRPRFCPACVAEIPIHRAVWELAIVDACPIHCCPLLSRCPNCGRRLTWQTFTLCSCGRCDPAPIPDATILAADLQGLLTLYHLIGEFHDPAAQAGLLLPNWFWKLGLQKAIELLVLPEALLSTVGRKGSALADRPADDPFYRTVQIGYDVLRDWPHQFERLLDEIRVPCRNEGSRLVLAYSWPKFISMMSNRPDSAPWIELRQAFGDYLSKQSGVVYDTRTKIIPDVAKSASAISAHEAARRLGTHVGVVTNLVKRGRLVGQMVGRGKSCRFLIDPESVEALRSLVADCVTTADIAERYGVSQKYVTRLVSRHGLLQPVCRSGDVVHERFFSRRDVESALGWVFQPIEPGGSGQFISLAVVMNRGTAYGLAKLDIFRVISNHRLRPRRIIDTTDFLRRFEFDEEEASAVLAELVATSKNGDIFSRAEARAYLQVSKIVFSRLVAMGMIKPAPFNPKFRVFRRSDVEALRQVWTHAAEIAKHHGTSCTLVLKTLHALGVKGLVLTFGSSKPFHLFKRSDLSSIDWAQELDAHAVCRGVWGPSRHTRYKAITGRSEASAKPI